MGVSAPLLPTVLISTEDMELYLLLDHILRFENFTSRLVAGSDEIRRLLQAAPLAVVLVECRGSADAFRAMCLALRQDISAVTVPILALVAQSAEREYVSSIGPEIADVLVRPIWPATLIQSIRCALKRQRCSRARIDGASEAIEYADLEMDLASHRVRRGGRDIHLSPIEFKLLRHLLEHPEQVVTRHDLRSAAWPRNVHVEPKTIDVHVGRLRQALSLGTETNLIRTIRSVGWALSIAPSDRTESPAEPADKGQGRS